MKSNNQKIIFGILIIIGLISTLSVFASAYNTESPYLRIVAEEVSPEPVEPGQDLTVKLRVTNEGGETAEDVTLKLNAKYPFFVKTQNNNFDEPMSLCAGCSIDNTYYLIVDANAKSGLYPLEFEIYRDDIIIKQANTIDIKVVGKPDILLETKAIEKDVASGDKFTINFDAKNIGTGTARKIKITPQSDNVLMLGTNVKLISEIKPEETVYFSSEFIIKESLSPDTYKFPINLEYVDEQGNNYETSFDIGVNVLNKADIGFQSIKITPINPTLADSVYLEGIVENTGEGDAQKVTVELITPEGKNYKAFIGQLKADDDAPFYFDVKPESIGMQTASLKVTYYDDFGIHSYETKIDKEVKRPTNNLLTAVIVFLIILAIIGYFYFKKKKAKKSNK